MVTCAELFQQFLDKRIKSGLYNQLYKERLAILFLNEKAVRKDDLFTENLECALDKDSLCRCTELRRKSNKDKWETEHLVKINHRREKGERTVLVCGSRGFDDIDLMRAELKEELSVGSILISGGAHGADRLALELWREANLRCITIHPDWARQGKSAGMLRNKEMYRTGVDKVYAFWDGFSRGTEHSIDIGKSLGIEVSIVEFSI